MPFLEISVHGHVKLPTPKEVNTPIRRKKNFSLSIEKMDSFLKIFRIQLFSKVLYMGMLLCSSLKFIICDIYNMFCAILTHYLTQYTNFIYINSILFISKFYPVRSFDCRWNNNLIILLYKRNILENLTLFCFWATF